MRNSTPSTNSDQNHGSHRFTFVLKDESGLAVTFIDSDVWVTLHLIRYPF